MTFRSRSPPPPPLTPTSNESSFESKPPFPRVLQRRTIHTYHSDGRCGGPCSRHHPVCGAQRPALFHQPTRPSPSTPSIAFDMLMVCHHLDKKLPEDWGLRNRAIRAETIAAKIFFMILGASASFLPTRRPWENWRGITRTFATADKTEAAAWPAPPIGRHDNFRIRRYIARSDQSGDRPRHVALSVDWKLANWQIRSCETAILWRAAGDGDQIRMMLIPDGRSQLFDPDPPPVSMLPMFRLAWPSAVDRTVLAFVSNAIIHGNSSRYQCGTN